MLWLAHGTPNLVLVNLQAALPIATVGVLLWSARRHITRTERIIVLADGRMSELCRQAC